jgi:hypothetical protein
MSEITITLQQLRSMIGLKVYHLGIPCMIVEVLEDGPSLVLVDQDDDKIQSDQYGNPLRKVPKTFTVPVLTPDGSAIHSAYLALDLISLE